MSGSYCGVSCWNPGDILDSESYLLIKDGIFSNFLKAPVVSIHFPPDQVIATDKITIVIKK